MPNDTVDLGVAQLLRGSRTLLGVCRIVFCNQFKFDFFATNHHGLGIQLLNRKASPIFIVTTKVRLRTRHWSNVANTDHGLRLCKSWDSHHNSRCGNSPRLASQMIVHVYTIQLI